MIIKNVKLVLENSILENAEIVIKDGIIQEIRELPGKGNKILIPGFIDTHIHGFYGYDSMDGIDALNKISDKLPKFGTTSYMPTIMTDEKSKMLKSLKSIVNSAEKSKGASIVGIHAEGPFISKEKKGAHNPKYLLNPTEKYIDEFVQASSGLLKRITFAPEIFSIDLVKYMIQNNIYPSIGHTNATYDQTMKVMEHGVVTCTHLWNAMSGIVNRQQGAVLALLEHDNVKVELITDFVHLDERTIRFSIKTKGVDNVYVVTDSIRPAGLKNGTYDYAGGFQVEKKDSLLLVKGTNTIAGSGATMYDCFINLIKLNYSLLDSVKMTSTNASKIFNLQNIGIIKKSYIANLIQLNENLTIDKVYIKGEEY